MWTWLKHLTGTDNANSIGYLFWSGIGGYAFAAGAYLRRHNCHSRWCPRIGRHPVDGSPYATCRKHHPDLGRRAPSAEDIATHSQGES